MEVEARYRRLAQANEVPLLRVQAASGLPPWGFGLICGALTSFVLMLPLWAVDLGPGFSREVLGSALFFGTSFAILAGFTTPVFRGAAADLRALAPIIPLPEDDLECLARGLTRATRRQVSVAALTGLTAGAVHSFLLGHFNLSLGFLIPQFAATEILWVVMFTTLTKLVLNAAVFSRLGTIAEPDLLRPSRQAPFGSAALRPALFLIGTLCAYALLFIGDDDPLNDATSIGAILSLFSLFGIVTLPLRGIRLRIGERRRAILKALDARLEAGFAGDMDQMPVATMREMDTILDMRERVAQAPGWPLDLAGVRRILLYIVLPPLTWAAAAVVEMLIDAAV